MTIKASDLNVIGSFASQSNSLAIMIDFAQLSVCFEREKNTRNDVH
jgi:hypothetical protein